MISVFLREQKRYTQEDLVKEFQCWLRTVRIREHQQEYHMERPQEVRGRNSSVYVQAVPRL